MKHVLKGLETRCLNFQADLPGHLLGRDGDQERGSRLHPQQLQLPQEPLELARLHRHPLRLPHLLHRDGKPGRTEDVQGAQGAQDSVNHAK